MTEDEARQRCAELSESSPDRETHSFLPRKGSDGEWTVVRLAVPPPRAPETTATKPVEPETARDDPRTAFEQNVPPHGVGL